MKKHVIVFACLFALCLGLAACGSGNNESSSSASSESSSAASSSAEASSSAAASSESASAASSTAAADGVSYELSDRTFSEAYEKDGKIYYDGVGEIVNTGSETLVVDFADIDALDEDFQELASSHGVYISPDYILPGGSAFVYPTRSIELPSSCSVDDTYHISVNASISATDKTMTEYPLSEVKAYEANGRPCIGCVVTNDTKAASGDITVVVTYLDKDGQILGVGEKTISDLKPGETAIAVILDDTLPNRCNWADVADYTLHATSLN